MKIVIVGTAYPLRGGIAHYNALLACALARSHDVETLTFSRQYPSLLFPGKSQEEGADLPGIPPAPAVVDSINPLNWIAVGRRIRAMRPDLILFKYWLPFFGPCFGTIARVAKRGNTAKVIYICDNVIPHEHRPGDRLFTRYAFGPAHGFIVQSTSVEQDLRAFQPGARYVKVHHPVYEGFGDPVDPGTARTRLGLTAKNVLLFFGYVRKYKGLATLLNAMALVSRDLDVHLVIAGEFYEPEGPYREQINALGLASRVTLRSDYLPSGEIPDYFSAADAVVLPYTSATQSGIAQIAFHFGTPVIASAIGGLAEDVQDGLTGVLVPPGDPKALAEGITAFFTRFDRMAMRARVLETRKRYSWDTLVRGIEQLAEGG